MATVGLYIYRKSHSRAKLCLSLVMKLIIIGCNRLYHAVLYGLDWLVIPVPNF